VSVCLPVCLSGPRLAAFAGRLQVIADEAIDGRGNQLQSDADTRENKVVAQIVRRADGKGFKLGVAAAPGVVVVKSSAKVALLVVAAALAKDFEARGPDDETHGLKDKASVDDLATDCWTREA